MDYDIKANITTILTFFLMPVFASLGVDAITGNAMIGALAVLIFYVLMYLNERYLSKIFTKEGYDVVKSDDVTDTVIQSGEDDGLEGAQSWIRFLSSMRT